MHSQEKSRIVCSTITNVCWCTWYIWNNSYRQYQFYDDKQKGSYTEYVQVWLHKRTEADILTKIIAVDYSNRDRFQPNGMKNVIHTRCHVEEWSKTKSCFPRKSHNTVYCVIFKLLQTQKIQPIIPNWIICSCCTMHSFDNPRNVDFHFEWRTSLYMNDVHHSLIRI